MTHPDPGTRYGLWTVLGPAEPAHYGPTLTTSRSRTVPRTRVRCECGMIRAVHTSELRSGRSRGCRPCRSKGQRPRVGSRERSAWERGERSGSDAE